MVIIHGQMYPNLPYQGPSGISGGSGRVVLVVRTAVYVISNIMNMFVGNAYQPLEWYPASRPKYWS